jgi:starch-binding outer membrane protein, SusD/RagB family
MLIFKIIYMKKIKILSGFLLCLFIVSCKKNFLDGTKPQNQISDADVWKSPDLAKKVINGCYRSLPAGHAWFMMMSATDEGTFQYNDLGDPYTHGTVSATNLGCFDVGVWAWGAEDWNWTAVYSNIRNANLAIANLDQVPFETQTDKDKTIADAYFIRGFSYFLLMAQYGGVPLYDKPVQLGSNYNTPRASFEETINFIVKDLDKAIGLYPAADIGSIKTRADKGVAMAIKAKVLLYAASDLHNNAKNSAVVSGFAHPELLGYVGGDATARWQAAKAAAKAVIDLGKYQLYTGNTDFSRNFEEIFVKRSGEDIFLRYADPVNDLYYALGRTPEWQGAPGHGGTGVNAVLGNLVDAFEMNDGTKFSWSNPVQAANPYANRDPRLKASVLYEGTDWYPQASTNDKVRVGVWPDGSQAPSTGMSNYWLRKFIDVNLGPQNYSGELNKCPPWVRMRYAEVLLNYAEACIELGQDAEARTYINMVRSRAGMPNVTESGSALKDRYRNERRVELAFEEQRFFDVRRWLIGPSSATNGTGVMVTYPVNGSFNNPTYSTTIADAGRAWVNKEYFLPISKDEVNKNTALIQNPGY